MISKKDIIKMVRGVVRHSKGLPPRRSIYPAREWAIGLVVSMVALIGTCAASAFVYIELSTIEETIEASTATVVRYQKTNAEETQARFDERSLQLAAIRDAVPERPVATSSAVVSPGSDEEVDELELSDSNPSILPTSS